MYQQQQVVKLYLVELLLQHEKLLLDLLLLQHEKLLLDLLLLQYEKTTPKPTPGTTKPSILEALTLDDSLQVCRTFEENWSQPNSLYGNCMSMYNRKEGSTLYLDQCPKPMKIWVDYNGKLQCTTDNYNNVIKKADYKYENSTFMDNKKKGIKTWF
jgi:hypothetical protein